jgi:uncharacterized protein YkwD
MARRLLVLMLALVPLLSAPTIASAMGAPERRALDLVDGVRDRHGLRTLVVRPRLMRYAERHTRLMASKRTLFHSSLSVGRFSAVGECVGLGGNVRQVFKAFMASTTHRRIILGTWRYIGIGVASRDGTRYVTLEFAR